MKSEHFHMRLRPFLMLGAVTALATYLSLTSFQLALDFATGSKATWYSLTQTPAMQWILLFLFIQFWSVAPVVVLVRLASFRVGPDGLRSWNIVGWPVFMAWTEPIQRIELKSMLRIPYLEIRTADGRQHVLATYNWTARPRRFARVIAQHAGPDHALVVWMNQHWHAPEAE